MQAASRLNEPVDLVQVPLFNPTASYSSYVVPAAFVLILHQTLLMGAAMLGGAIYERGGQAARRTRASATAILGQGLAHWTLYVPAMLLYFIVMPRIFGFSTLGSVWAMAALSIPFILATSFLGQALGLVFRHRETAVLLVLASSLPQFFLVGVSWPVEALPGFLQQLRVLLPSVDAIDGMVRINQMGASLGEVRPDWMRLWALTLLYFAASHCVGARARRPRAESMLHPSRRVLLLAGLPTLVVALCVVWYWWPGRSGDAPSAVGMVRATEIRIAPEVSGKLARFLVASGQAVQQDQPVALLNNPELWAALGLARAQVEKARSDRDRVYAGVRNEQVQMLQREIQKAQAVHIAGSRRTGTEDRAGRPVGRFVAGP